MDPASACLGESIYFAIMSRLDVAIYAQCKRNNINSRVKWLIYLSPATLCKMSEYLGKPCEICHFAIEFLLDLGGGSHLWGPKQRYLHRVWKAPSFVPRRTRWQ